MKLDEYWNLATHDGDDNLVKQGLYCLGQIDTTTVQLNEFYEYVKSSFDISLPLNAQINWLTEGHLGLQIPIGPALAVLAKEKINLDDAFHPNAGMRALAAMMSSDANIHLQLAYDPCVLVRCVIAALYRFNSEIIFDELCNDPYQVVRDIITEIHEIDTDSVIEEWQDSQFFNQVLGIEHCPCSTDTAENFETLYRNFTEFALPSLDDEFMQKIRDVNPCHWSTQAFPIPMDDYLMTTIDYLKRPIPDQVSICHAGHGVNSYALTFRYALGGLAILAQTGWGGAYGDKESDNERWQDLLDNLDPLIEMNPYLPSDGYFERDFILINSDFRGLEYKGDLDQSSEEQLNSLNQSIPIVLARNTNDWEPVPGLDSWEEIYDFFRNIWFKKD